MRNLKGLMSLCVAVTMIGLPAWAAEDKASAPQVKPTKEGVVVTTELMSGNPQFKLAEMSVLLDGAVYPMSLLPQMEGQLSIIVDEESLQTGVARAYRTHEEFDAYVAEKGKSCPAADATLLDTTSQCLFYDSLDCTGWTRRLAINCGTAAGNLAGLIPIQSFSLGCGTTFVCPTPDCSGTCSAVSGPAGTCINITAGVVQCAGCANF